MKVYMIVLVTSLFALVAICGDIALINAKSHVVAAQDYLSTNGVASVYNTNMPIRIYTPASHPELLIGFPFKKQDPVVSSNGWVEIGIKFDCGMSPGVFRVTIYPDENQNRVVMRFNTNEHSRSCRSITNYNQLLEQ